MTVNPHYPRHEAQQLSPLARTIHHERIQLSKKYDPLEFMSLSTISICTLLQEINKSTPIDVMSPRQHRGLGEREVYNEDYSKITYGISTPREKI